MKRLEEIIEAGIDYTMRNRPNVLAGDMFSEEMKIFNRNKAFEEIAKWADKTMINKACAWLETILYIHTEMNEDKDLGEMSVINWVTSDYDSVEEFIHRFRKAMEE